MEEFYGLVRTDPPQKLSHCGSANVEQSIMLRIIDGMVYNTETAEELCEIGGVGQTLPRNDFRWERTSLYRSTKGKFFIAGSSGPLARWAIPVRGGKGEGEGLRLIDESEARTLVEQHADYDTYVTAFGPPDEG